MWDSGCDACQNAGDESGRCEVAGTDGSVYVWYKRVEESIFEASEVDLEHGSCDTDLLASGRTQMHDYKDADVLGVSWSVSGMPSSLARFLRSVRKTS